MFALTSKAALVPAKVRVNIAADRKKSARSTSSPSNPRRISRVVVKASSKNNNEDGPSRRDILAAPGLAAFLSAAAAPATTLWLPGAALAKPAGKGGIKPTNVTGFDSAIAVAKLGPIGGAVPCSDYKAWEKTIYGFIDGIKSGECPPAFKNATRAFLLKQDGVPAGTYIFIFVSYRQLKNRRRVLFNTFTGQDPLVMLTVLIPEADQKAGLAFFVNKGPKANPLWATDDIKAFTTLDPFTATASVAKFVR